LINVQHPGIHSVLTPWQELYSTLNMACILVEAELQNMKEQFIEADRDLDTLDQVKRLIYLMNTARQLINLLVRNY
jgi:hypothetical protein